MKITSDKNKKMDEKREEVKVEVDVPFPRRRKSFPMKRITWIQKKDMSEESEESAGDEYSPKPKEEDDKDELMHKLSLRPYEVLQKKSYSTCTTRRWKFPLQ